MIRSRALDPPRALCCLPSPHRITHSVAGMAFNFSKVELVQPAPRRKSNAPAEKPRNTSGAERRSIPRSCFGLPQYSPAT
jgi:hypothetical protein